MKKLMRIPTLQFVHKSIACLLAFCVINMPVWAIQNGDYTSDGGANIVITDNVLTNVNLGNAAQTTIEWTNIDTVQNEVLNFNGQGNFAVLNNVTSTDVTNFSGILNGGGGNIMIVNPNGLVFGATAQISAGHFTASTLAVADFGAFVNGEGSWFNTADAKGMIELEAGSSINATNINLIAQEIKNAGHLISDGGVVMLITGDQVFLGSQDYRNIIVNVELPTNNDNLSYSIDNAAEGVIDNAGGTIVLAAGDTFAQALGGLHGQAYTVSEYTVAQSGTLKSGTLEMGAANAILTIDGSDTQADTINMGAQNTVVGEALTAGGDMHIDMDYSVTAKKDIASGGKMTVDTQESSILLAGTVTSGDTMDISAGTSLTLLGDAESGDSMTLEAAADILIGNVTVNDNDLSITAGDGTLAIGNLKAENNILLDTELVMFADGDQSIEAQNGGIVAESKITKLSEVGGELYISAQDDIQLDGAVTNEQGGVSVISKGGMIHTENTDTLNVAITGYSDEEAGVDLPYGDGKAAIVLMSNDTLKLGAGAVLTANGSYQPTILDPETGEVLVEGVDDRAGVNLLDTDDKIIGGFARDAGDPIDVAIYAASTSGNVEFGQAPIIVNNQLNNSEMGVGDATVVIDAFDSVIFDFDLFDGMTVDEIIALLSVEPFEGSYRLEVVSRITQFLGEAIANGTLPFAGDPEVMELLFGNDYVLRGAGVPSNGYKEAWVLEDGENVPVAALQQLVLPELKGCPAEMDAAAAELSVNTDQMQMMIANSMASNPSIQPCKACSSLLTAAAALKDVDGTRMAALAEIFNTLAPADAPFTPEVQASISTAFADLSADNPQYAMAMEYADAFANYVAILDNDLKLPVGDSVALVMEKYGDAVANAENPNIATFINGQIEANIGSL